MLTVHSCTLCLSPQRQDQTDLRVRSRSRPETRLPGAARRAVSIHLLTLALQLLCCYSAHGAVVVPSDGMPAAQVSSACGAWLPDLMKVKSWRSHHSRCQSDITVVTQLSVDRFDMLERLCLTWKGWVSAAVYLPLTNPDYTHLHTTVALLDAFNAMLEQSDKCKLDMMLYTPQGTPDPDRPLMHPLNALRNKAIAAAQTEVLLLLDVDFMVSSSLNEPQHSAWIHDMVSSGTLVVLPAFEPVHEDTAGQEAVLRTCSGGKAAALEGIGSGFLQPFHLDRFQPGHGPTNVPQWASSNEAYHVSYDMGYEPYVLVSKNLVPWYDERFTGYLEDKVVHIQTMVSMGFRFAVHPGAFVVHYPHPNSRDQQLVKATSLMHEIQAMGDGARFEMDHGMYLPPTRFAPCHQPYRTPASTGTVSEDVCTDRPAGHAGGVATARRHVAAADALRHRSLVSTGSVET